MMRREWVEKRKNDTVRTQMYYAKQGIVTEEMEPAIQADSASKLKNSGFGAGMSRYGSMLPIDSRRCSLLTISS